MVTRMADTEMHFATAALSAPTFFCPWPFSACAVPLLALERPLLPVIQLVIRIGNGDPGLLQIADGTGDVSGRHVVAWIIVEEDDEDACVMTLRGKDNKVVQGLEVIGVPR